MLRSVFYFASLPNSRRRNKLSAYLTIVRTRPGILIFFIGLNCLQLGVIGNLLHRNSVAVSPSSPSKIHLQPKPVKKVIPVTAKFNWSNVESADYKRYIANLRASGCPEETVRDIIIADVDKLFAARRQTASVTPEKDLKYWEPEPDDGNEISGREKWKQEQTKENEKRLLLKELLGVDLNSERRKLAGEEDMVEKRLRFLPTEKRQQVRLLLEKFNEQEQIVREKALETGSVNDTENPLDLKRIHAARQAELAKVLSPREIELFELWTSDAAIATRHSLAGLEEPSEQEFLAIYKLRKRFDEEFNTEVSPIKDAERREKLEKATTEMENQIEAEFGEQRYAQYLRGQDSDYRQLAEISRRFHLPREAAGRVYDLRKAAENQTIKIQADESLPAEKRKVLIQEIRQNAGESVQELLGEEASQLYRRTESAGWLE